MMLYLLLRADTILLVLGNGRSRVGSLVQRSLSHHITGTLHGQMIVAILAESVLLLVDVAEREIEYNCQDGTGNRWSTEIPGKEGIPDNR